MPSAATCDFDTKEHNFGNIRHHSEICVLGFFSLVIWNVSKPLLLILVYVQEPLEISNT